MGSLAASADGSFLQRLARAVGRGVRAAVANGVPLRVFHVRQPATASFDAAIADDHADCHASDYQGEDYARE